MVGLLTISDEMGEEMEEDLAEACEGRGRIITYQHHQIVKLGSAAKALINWAEDPDSKPDDLHEIIAMAKKAMP